MRHHSGVVVNKLVDELIEVKRFIVTCDLYFRGSILVFFLFSFFFCPRQSNKIRALGLVETGPAGRVWRPLPLDDGWSADTLRACLKVVI